MYPVRKKIVTDEQARPVAVQIDYADWLEIERRLQGASPSNSQAVAEDRGPLAGTILWQGDLVSPLEEAWDAEQ